MFSDNFRRGEGKTKGMAGSKIASRAADLGWTAFSRGENLYAVRH